MLVTDGQPDNRETTMTLARTATTSGIQVIAIGTNDADLSFLAQLSTAQDLARKVDPQQLRESIGSAAQLLPAPRKPA